MLLVTLAQRFVYWSSSGVRHWGLVLFAASLFGLLSVSLRPTPCQATPLGRLFPEPGYRDDWSVEVFPVWTFRRMSTSALRERTATAHLTWSLTTEALEPGPDLFDLSADVPEGISVAPHSASERLKPSDFPSMENGGNVFTLINYDISLYPEGSWHLEEALVVLYLPALPEPVVNVEDYTAIEPSWTLALFALAVALALKLLIGPQTTRSQRRRRHSRHRERGRHRSHSKSLGARTILPTLETTVAAPSSTAQLPRPRGLQEVSISSQETLLPVWADSHVWELSPSRPSIRASTTPGRPYASTTLDSPLPIWADPAVWQPAAPAQQAGESWPVWANPLLLGEPSAPRQGQGTKHRHRAAEDTLPVWAQRSLWATSSCPSVPSDP